MAIAGKYTFESQDNFGAFLEAMGLSEELRELILGSNPEVTVEVDGDNYKFTTHTEIKDVVTSFTLGQEYEADPGTGNVGKFITTLEGDTLVTKKLNAPEAEFLRKFTDDGMTLTAIGGGVTATNVFKRA
jgi:hypothetical protein